MNTNSDYAIIIAARMGSERLPGKALVDYGGGPNLAQIVQRWQRSHRSPTVIVATTEQVDDAAIVSLCAALGVPCYRGSTDDVVGRMNSALRAYAPGAAYVARALADNPLVDVWLADWRLDVLREAGAGGLWYGGDHDRITYCGTTDVWSRAAWDMIAASSSGSRQREHAGAYYWDHLDKFSVVQIPLPPREFVTGIRTEFDTAEDLAMLCAVWDARADKLDPCVPADFALRWLAGPGAPAALLNASVATKTLTRPAHGRERAWVCEHCAGRMGGVVQGDLRVRCVRCGCPRKFYARKPAG